MGPPKQEPQCIEAEVDFFGSHQSPMEAAAWFTDFVNPSWAHAVALRVAILLKPGSPNFG